HTEAGRNVVEPRIPGLEQDPVRYRRRPGELRDVVENIEVLSTGLRRRSAKDRASQAHPIGRSLPTGIAGALAQNSRSIASLLIMVRGGHLVPRRDLRREAAFVNHPRRRAARLHVLILDVVPFGWIAGIRVREQTADWPRRAVAAHV